MHQILMALLLLALLGCQSCVGPSNTVSSSSPKPTPSASVTPSPIKTPDTPISPSPTNTNSPNVMPSSIPESEIYGCWNSDDATKELCFGEVAINPQVPIYTNVFKATSGGLKVIDQDGKELQKYSDEIQGVFEISDGNQKTGEKPNLFRISPSNLNYTQAPSWVCSTISTDSQGMIAFSQFMEATDSDSCKDYKPLTTGVTFWKKSLKK